MKRHGKSFEASTKKRNKRGQRWDERFRRKFFVEPLDERLMLDGTINITAWTNAAEQMLQVGQFTLTRTAGLMQSASVNFSFGGSANHPADYTVKDQNGSPLNGSVTFMMGQSQALVRIHPVDDALAEAAESVIMTLTSCGNCTLGPNNSGTIADNDTPAGPPTSLTQAR